MIDTLKLSLIDYEIDSNPDLSLIVPATDLRTGAVGAVHPLWVSNGRAVEGAKAFHNADAFNVTIKPVVNGITGCFVQFSAPKVLHQDNFVLADAAAVAKAAKQLEKQLRAIGIRTNISKANISRLDAAKNVSLIDPCPNYFPVLAMLKGKRMAKRDYGTTHLWGNKSQEICVYDKLQEMQARKMLTSGLPQNTMRFEWRLLKSPKFQAATGMKTLNDVCKNYDHIAHCYSENIKKQLFKHTVPEFNLLSTPQLEDEFKIFAERGDACWWGACIRAKAFQGLSAFDYDVMLNAALKSAKNRMEASRIRRDFDKWRADSLALPVASAQRTTAELYSELQSKVLA